MTAVIIGRKILEARKKNNLSQMELAEKLAISSQAIGKWEHGKSLPDIIMLNRVAQILGVDMNYFSESFPSASSEPAVSDQPTLARDDVRQEPWNMSGGNWLKSDFSDIKNLGEKFNGANIRGCLFIGSDLSGLTLSGNNMKENDMLRSDLSNGKIKNSHVINNQFRECVLRGTLFSGSQIKNCDFSEADFTDVIFYLSAFLKNIVAGAVWKGTTFRFTQIVDTVFEGSITACAFEQCSFLKVTFQNAVLTNTFFKCRTLRKIRFIDCQADKLTYAFLKNGKVDMTGISMITPNETV